MTAPLVFIDTETTGLEPGHDEIWEIAAIRRESDGSQHHFHWQVEHSLHLVEALPEKFRADHDERFEPGRALSIFQVRGLLLALFSDRPHLVAANPAFDTAFLRALIGSAPWHYHLIDVEAMAIGYLHARARAIPFELVRGGGSRESMQARFMLDACGPPWKSDELSRLCGVSPPTQARHTAMGDANWAMHWYDTMAVQ